MTRLCRDLVLDMVELVEAESIVKTIELDVTAKAWRRILENRLIDIIEDNDAMNTFTNQPLKRHI